MKKSFGAKPLVHAMPVWIVGTYDQDGKPNAMTVAYGGICCSQPPCVAVSLRESRHSFAGIVQRKAFTVSIPSVEQVREADYVGIYSGAEENKFTACGLTALRSELVDAPYVEEFPLVLECRLIKTVEIGVHTQFIGEILDVKADEQVLNEAGLPDPTRVKPIVFAPGVGLYFGLGECVAQAFSVGKRK